MDNPMKENKNPTVQKEGGIPNAIGIRLEWYPHIQRDIPSHLVDAERTE